MEKDKLMKELQELLYRTSYKFINKNKLSIKYIKINKYTTTIIENTTIMDSPSMTKEYRFSNHDLYRELDNELLKEE